jgi:hypothetical protein
MSSREAFVVVLGGAMLDDLILNEYTAIPPLRKKRGGRRRGSKNKRTVEREKALATIKASGADPLAFFADLLKNEDAPLELRFQAAKELAPYVHPRLQSIESRSGQMSQKAGSRCSATCWRTHKRASRAR